MVLQIVQIQFIVCVGKSKDDLVIRVVNSVSVEHAEFEKFESNHIKRK